MQKDTHEANGARFIARDDMIVAWCRDTGQPFEPMTTAFMMERLKGRRGLFVDVGASTGWFSIPFAMGGHEVPQGGHGERMHGNKGNMDEYKCT